MKKLDFSLILPLVLTLFLLLEGYLINSIKLDTQFLIYAWLILEFFTTKTLVGVIGVLFEYFFIKNSEQERISVASSALTQQTSDTSFLLLGMYYFILGCLDLISWLYYFYPTYVINMDPNDVIMEIIPKAFIPTIASFFSVKLLNHKLYSHHKFALIINFCSIIISFIIMTFQKIKTNFSSGITWLLFGIVCASFISLKEIGEKWMMFYKYRKQFLITLIEGIIGASILCFYMLYKYQFDRTIFHTCISDLENFFLEETKNHVLKTVLFLLASSVVNILFIIVNNKYNPTYRFICDSVYCCQFLLMLSDDVAKLLVISAIPNFFAALIYNEIIVLPWFNLDFNTKIGIDERERLERIKSKVERDFEDYRENSLVSFSNSNDSRSGK